MRTLALLTIALMGATGCGGDDEIPEDARTAVPLQALARGEHTVRGGSSEGVAVRSGRRVTVIGARRSTVTVTGTSMLLPDLDGDLQPEVAASLGPELERRLAVSMSGGGGRVVVRRRGWDVAEVRGKIGGRWLVVAFNGDGAWLLGFAPRTRRWELAVRLPGSELDDVDVRGERLRVAAYAPQSSRSTVLDLVVRGDRARIAKTERRPVGVRTSDARIEPAWRLEEVTKPRYEGGSLRGRVELTRPDGERQVLSESDDDLPPSTLLRAGRSCAVVMLFRRTGKITISAVGADGSLRATQVVPRRGLSGVALLGRRLVVSRLERGGGAVRPLRLDPANRALRRA